MSSTKFSITLLQVLLFFFLLSTLTFGKENSQLIENSRQMLLVITADESAQTGSLYVFKREAKDQKWKIIMNKIQVVVGRKGLAWSSFNKSYAFPNFPKKIEGDNKSPAGVFPLGACFGFANESEMTELKIPYLRVTELTECIDDQNSKYYNNIVQRDTIDNLDWDSSEKMHRIDPEYKLGVIINYNTQ